MSSTRLTWYVRYVMWHGYQDSSFERPASTARCIEFLRSETTQGHLYWEATIQKPQGTNTPRYGSWCIHSWAMRRSPVKQRVKMISSKPQLFGGYESNALNPYLSHHIAEVPLSHPTEANFMVRAVRCLLMSLKNLAAALCCSFQGGWSAPGKSVFYTLVGMINY